MLPELAYPMTAKYPPGEWICDHERPIPATIGRFHSLEAYLAAIWPIRHGFTRARRIWPGSGRRRLAWLVLLSAWLACSAEDLSRPMPTNGDFILSSSAFAEGGTIPTRHTCDGDDASPPLEWSGAPDGTAAYALIVDDPDARGFVHWVVADIPGETTSIEEGASGSGGIGVEGRNQFGRTGWGGPCPPSGTHRYVFTLYALSGPLGLTGTQDADGVRSAMGDRLLGETRLSGSYTRGG
jgi:Raf kinase inhibitor-like YbhB/YbcL family protein